jgi:Toprim domain-containing protein
MKRYGRYKMKKIRMMQLFDPLVMLVTNETPQQRLDRGLPLFNTPGQEYVEKRNIPVALAHETGVRFDPDWNGRAAVIVPMRDDKQNLCSVHGRYLQQAGDQNKMFTIGPGGGVLNVRDGLYTDVIIIVEGMFDSLSLALCGYSSIATVGRKAPWLAEFCKGKTVVLAFDGNRPGDETAEFYQQWLVDAAIFRLKPPGHAKDWNSALIKKGSALVEQWLRFNLKRFAETKVPQNV